MKMKCSKSFILTVVTLLIVAPILWQRWNKMANAPVLTIPKYQIDGMLNQRKLERTNSAAPAAPVRSNHVPQNLGLRESAMEMSDAEKAEMTNLFVTRLKPAAEKWAAVYGNRVPFNMADLTMDKFVERLGRDSKTYHSYTFVMGDITFGIAQINDETQVQYLASKSGLATMRTLPTTGAAPDLSMPVSRQDVLAMAEADSGQQFAPNLVQLIPSAESGSLAGGAVANVGSEVKNAMGIPISKVSAGFNYVFAKSGALTFYLRAK